MQEKIEARQRIEDQEDKNDKFGDEQKRDGMKTSQNQKRKK